MIKQFFSIWPIISIICIIVAFITIRFWRKNKPSDQEENQRQAFIIYGLGFYSIGAVISTLTVGKVGSTVNYFLELITASALWCSIALPLIIKQKNLIKTTILGLLFIQLVWVLIVGYFFNRTTIGLRWQNLALYDSIYQQVQSASHKGIVLSDDYLDMVILSGQSIYYQPFEYGQLFNAGLWDPSKLSEEIAAKKFPLILISGVSLNKPCCWPKELVTSIENSYEILYKPTLVECLPKER